MVIVNDVLNSGYVSLCEFFGIIEVGWCMVCLVVQSYWICEGEEGGWLFVLLMFSCLLNFGIGKLEFMWIKGMQGRQGFYIVQKLFCVELEKDDVVQWIGWLCEVGLCGSGDVLVCC